MVDSSCSQEKDEASDEVITKWTDDAIRFDSVDDEPEKDFYDPFNTNIEETFNFSFPLTGKDGRDDGADRIDSDDVINIELKGFPHDSDVVWKSTGLTIWKSAEFLCQWMVDNRATFFSPVTVKQVLELGSGLGLNGILAHRLLQDPSCNVFLTDGDSEALIQLRQNIEKNRCHDNGSVVNGHQLIWGDDTSRQFLTQHARNRKFDIILASDIVYVKSVIAPLWETINNLLVDTNGVFVMGFARRQVPVSIEFVLEAATEAGFVFNCEVSDEENGIFLYTFRHK